MLVMGSTNRNSSANSLPFYGFTATALGSPKNALRKNHASPLSRPMGKHRPWGWDWQRARSDLPIYFQAGCFLMTHQPSKNPSWRNTAPI